MLNRLFLFNVRLGVFLASLGMTAFVGQPADAALQKYTYITSNVSQYLSESPKYSQLDKASSGRSVALVADASGPNPVLKKYKGQIFGIGVTLVLPALSGGFIFVSQASSGGYAGDQTGSGATASSINWGNLTGSTTSGATWCHSIPSYICPLANRVDLATTAAPNVSTNYDYGTWTFHGTGFTMIDGLIAGTGRTNPGNRRARTRGFPSNDGTVPAIPLLGISALGASVIAMSAAAMRRKKK